MKKFYKVIACLLALALVVTPYSFETEAAAAPANYVIKYESTYNPSELIYVIGHLNPDSDTVCSAIAYANFLTAMGYPATAAISGDANAETTYALNKFDVSMPGVLESAGSRQYVLVDHSLYEQSISGMSSANVLAILDHHAVGDVTTSNPSLYIGMPVGSTSTIVYREYKQYGITINKKMAGMMLTAILSDTLGLKSPTTTDYDKEAVKALMPIAEISDYEAYTDEILEAGNVYASLTTEQILKYDYKKFSSGNTNFSIGVVQSADDEQLLDIEKQLDAYMAENFDSLGVDMCFVMMTDLVEMDTKLLCYGNGALQTAQKAFGTSSDTIILKDTVSRKKQVAPPLTEALK